MKKFFSLLCVLMLALIPFSACTPKSENSNSNSNSNSANTEPLVVNMHYMHSFSAEPVKNNAMHKWLLENKNVDLRVTVDVDTDQLESKMNMMLASGLDYDVISILTDTTFNEIANKWGAAGHTASLDSYLEKYPSLSRMSDPTYDKKVYASKEDGKFYMLPGWPVGLDPDLVLNVGGFIREDWLKKVNKEVPTTVQELNVVLKAFKDEIKTVNGQSVIPMSFNHFRQWFGYSFTGNWYQAASDGSSVKWYWQTEGIADYMKYMNGAMREGLLDNEMFTQTNDQYLAKASSGRVGYTLGMTDVLDDLNASVKQVDPDAKFVPVPPLKNGADGAYPVMQQKEPRQYTALVVNKKFADKGDNMDRLMEFLAWSAESDNNAFLSNGVTADGKDMWGYYEETPAADGLVLKAENLADLQASGNLFHQKTGLQYYNIVRKFPDATAVKVSKNYTEAVLSAQTVWKPGVHENLYFFDMAGTGPKNDELWGTLWAEWAVLEAEAINAKSEADCQKVIDKSYKYFDENGGTEVANEKIALYKALLEEMKK